ncbi:hypothetical protein SJPD1_2747 [Sulfurospirillum diekertiae]|uniref:Uncharacterized protein n=1 Tax=Sulfurospirillum diekertiae TaxID=1854492 RepID=A0A290HY95_9BACT|nr:hypothetical protein [Sulfurospirillum diekertiae]ATB70836.1 hypothetical protein SJPD1_2747 [Sulfurospirillum diekertiae]
MSKWSENYSTHVFHQTWNDFKDKIKSINSEEIADQTLLLELARVNKVIQYTEDYLKLIDPDLNSLAVLTPLNNSIVTANTEITNFIANRNIGHIQNANTHLDTFLVQLKQINTILPSITKESINSIITSYDKAISDALKQIDLPTTISASQAINDLKNELIDKEDSIKSKIDLMVQESETKTNEITIFHDKTLIGNDATKVTIEEAKKDIIRDVEDAKNKLTNVSREIVELDKFYIRIFGKPDESDESKTSGLKYELDTRVTNLDNLEKSQQKKYEALVTQIEDLLSGATSVGLTKAYGDERKKFKTPIIMWNIVFIVSLIGMSVMSFLSLKGLVTLDDLVKQIFHSLPIIAPLIWLALYASKRRSENQRLEQEYAHKEALAKSYSSYKQQIEELDQEDKVLIIKLLESTINTISYNVSEVLDKKHGDTLPIQELIKSITELKSMVPTIKP